MSRAASRVEVYPRGALATCLFDLDGTLIDSIELILSSYRHTMIEHRGGAPGRDFWLAGLGTPLKEQFKHFSSDAHEIEAMIATYRAWNLAHHDEFVKPYDGALEAVQSLAARGLQLGIVTSKPKGTARRGLALCGFHDLFETLIGIEDVDRHKPDPEPVRVALLRIGARAETAIFVGDSPHDLAAGRAAGVRTAAALWGPFAREALAAHAPDVWLDEPRAIANLC